MARTNSLNKYLAGTPYAVLSMEALESDQLDALFLSLENESNRYFELKARQADLTRSKTIDREFALSLESIDSSILPFNPLGFTVAPSKTGLTVTQESLSSAIAEGAKKVWEFILEILRRIGAALGLNKTAARAAREAAKRAQAIRYEEFDQVLQSDDVTALLVDIARAETTSILKAVTNYVGSEFKDQSVVVIQIMQSAARKQNDSDQLIERLNRRQPGFSKISAILEAYKITVDFSEPVEKYTRDYFAGIEEYVAQDTRDSSRRRLHGAGSRMKKTTEVLATIADTIDTMDDGLARANEQINRIIKQNSAGGSDWFGPELVGSIQQIYQSQLRLLNLIRNHMTYCTAAVNKVTARIDDVRKELP